MSPNAVVPRAGDPLTGLLRQLACSPDELVRAWADRLLREGKQAETGRPMVCAQQGR